MSRPRLATGLFVAALMRRVQAAGGSAMVLAKGDADAGGLIAICAERGEIKAIIERAHDLEGRPEWRKSGGQVIEGQEIITDYLDRRRARDRDLWAIELDIADSERFAAEMMTVS